MYVVFVVIGAAVVFAVMAVAAGRGDLLDDVDPAASARLPEGPLTAADLDRLSLPVAARGYRMDHVDDVLFRVRDELAARDRRIAELESAGAGSLPRRTPPEQR